MPLDRLGNARKQSHFYQHNYYFLVKTSLLGSLILLGLSGYAAYLLYSEPTPLYFATTTDGKIMEVTPLSAGDR